MNPANIKLRPTSVSVIGSLNLALELICGLGCNPAMLLVLIIPSAMRTQILEEGYHGSAVYYGLSVALLLISLLATIVSIIGNIAMLNMRPWGRRIVVGYAAFSIMMCLVAMTVSGFFDGSALAAGGLPAQRRSELIMGLVLNGGCLVIFGLLYPALQLYLLTRPDVVEAFLRPAPGPDVPPTWPQQGGPPSGNFWDQMPPSGYPPQMPPPPPYPPPPDPRDR